jgi:hypothetical protein
MSAVVHVAHHRRIGPIKQRAKPGLIAHHIVYVRRDPNVSNSSRRAATSRPSRHPDADPNQDTASPHTTGPAQLTLRCRQGGPETRLSLPAEGGRVRNAASRTGTPSTHRSAAIANVTDEPAGAPAALVRPRADHTGSSSTSVWPARISIQTQLLAGSAKPSAPAPCCAPSERAAGRPETCLLCGAGIRRRRVPFPVCADTGSASQKPIHHRAAGAQHGGAPIRCAAGLLGVAYRVSAVPSQQPGLYERRDRPGTACLHQARGLLDPRLPNPRHRHQEHDGADR